jgi:hypothetical protein
VAEGEALARAVTQRNEIPAAFLTADPQEQDAWLTAARAAISSLLIGA